MYAAISGGTLFKKFKIYIILSRFITMTLENIRQANKTELTSSLEEQHSRKGLWERVLQHLERKSPSCNSHSEHFSVYFLSFVLWQVFSSVLDSA